MQGLPVTSQRIKAEARRLGFFACGVAKAGRVSFAEEVALTNWLQAGRHGVMGYMARNVDKRIDPRRLMPGVKSIVCVAMNYAPENQHGTASYQFADYALGKDYHDVVKRRLRQLAESLGLSRYRAFCDSAPVLERYWAVQAGLGWTGRNRQLIIPHAGPKCFLGELFLDVELECDAPMQSRCGRCRRCIDACPTKALTPTPSGETQLDARRCISYHTIENHGDIPPSVARRLGNRVYGCDACQDACPWNRFARPTAEAEFKPADAFLRMAKDDWRRLTEDEFRRLFKGSAVKRAKYQGLMRNIRAVEDNR